MNVDAEGRVWMREIRCCYTWRETCLLTNGMLYLCWCLCPCWSSCSWSCVQVEWVALERVVWTFWLIRPEVSSVKSWWCRACSVVAVDVVGETVTASVKRWNCVELLTWGWDDIPLTLLMFVASSIKQMWCEMLIWVQMLLNVDCQIVVCRILSMLVLIDVPWLKAARDDKRTLSVKLRRWGDWNLSWGSGRSHVRFLVVAVPSQSLVVHLPIAERLHHLMTKPDCCLFCCVVASSSSELYLKTDDACSSGSPICWWNLVVVACSSELPICCDCKWRRTLGWWGSSRDLWFSVGFTNLWRLRHWREDEFATKFIYNNGNNAPTDNITAWVAA